MAEHGDCDPWAGGLISHGRTEQLEELQRRFEALADGDPGFSVTVEWVDRHPAITRMVKRIGRAFAEQQVAMTLEELMRGRG